jgi:Protein of unknown function (DUF1177)
MDALLSMVTTRGNRVINHRGFAISQTVKAGWILPVRPDLLTIQEQVTGRPPVTLPLAMQGNPIIGGGRRRTDAGRRFRGPRASTLRRTCSGEPRSPLQRGDRHHVAELVEAQRTYPLLLTAQLVDLLVYVDVVCDLVRVVDDELDRPRVLLEAPGRTKIVCLNPSRSNVTTIRGMASSAPSGGGRTG